MVAGVHGPSGVFVPRHVVWGEGIDIELVTILLHLVMVPNVLVKTET